MRLRTEPALVRPSSAPQLVHLWVGPHCNISLKEYRSPPAGWVIPSNTLQKERERGGWGEWEGKRKNERERKREPVSQRKEREKSREVMLAVNEEWAGERERLIESGGSGGDRQSEEKGCQTIKKGLCEEPVLWHAAGARTSLMGNAWSFTPTTSPSVSRCLTLFLSI